MRVLIACEESQEVCKAFRALGHEAFSCDLQDCSGGHPEWHIKGDALEQINKNWDLIIAHPPCTFLTVAGNAWFDVAKYGDKARKRLVSREDAVQFFMRFVNADCPRIAIENPIGVMSTRYRKPDQIIQPYMFGENARKSTCLWLKGLPNLTATNIVDPGEIREGGFSIGAHADGRGKDGKWMRFNDPELAKLRSKTFHGIAMAMAEQWGGAV